MTQEFIFQLWLGLTVLSTIFILLIRASHTLKWKFSLTEALDLAVAVSGLTSSIYVFSKIWLLQTQLIALVGIDGLVMITVGSAVPIWFAAQKFKTLASRR
jgi:hypothetical protein